MTIRPYQNGDEVAIVNLFLRSVLELGPAKYSDNQVKAWAACAPERADPGAWAERMRDRETLVAAEGEKILGWIELARGGHLDMLYCAPEAAGRSVADELYRAIVARARRLGIHSLFTEASLFAESFFRKHGWNLDEREVVIRNGVEIPRARMSIDSVALGGTHDGGFDGVDAASNISIRALEIAEWEAFREMRLRALETEPGVFASSLEIEAAMNPAEWRTLIGGPGRRIFGLFDGARLVGITAAFTWRDDPTGETAIFAMSFLLPQYRGQGLSRLFFDARLDWIRTLRTFRRVVVSPRDPNEASRRANQRSGFKFLRRERRAWPDGQTADELMYELRLLPRSADNEIATSAG